MIPSQPATVPGHNQTSAAGQKQRETVATVLVHESHRASLLQTLQQFGLQSTSQVSPSQECTRVSSCTSTGVTGGAGIRTGDLLLGKYKNTVGWYECKVVREEQGGRWIIEWEDGDKADTLKEPQQLKRRGCAKAGNSARAALPDSQEERMEENMVDTTRETEQGSFDPLLPPVMSADPAADLAACSRKRRAFATFQPQPFAAARQARCVARSALRARESAPEKGDAVCSEIDPDKEKDKEADSARGSPADGGTSGWVSWRDASGNLVMVEKQRTSGPGAQFGRNDASAFGAQNESDEDDFVTITGVTRVDDPVASIDLCQEADAAAAVAVSGGRRDSPAAAVGRGGPGGGGRGLLLGRGLPPGGMGRGLPGRVPPCLPPPAVGTGVRGSGDVYCQFTSFAGAGGAGMQQQPQRTSTFSTHSQQVRDPGNRYNQVQTQEFLEFLLRTGRMSSDQSTAALSQRTGSGGPGASLSTQYPSLTTIRARGLEHSAFLIFLYFWMVAPNARQLWHCTFADLCRQHSSSGRFWCTDGVANKHSRALLVLDIILQHFPTPQGDDTSALNAKIIMEAVMRPDSS